MSLFEPCGILDSKSIENIMIRRAIKLITFCFIMSACNKPATHKVSDLDREVQAMPTQVVSDAKESEWRSLDEENTFYLKLDAGFVIIEMLPDLSPAHVENTKALIRNGIFDGTNFYRVIDGFVAQGGPMFESEADMPALSHGSFSVPSELTSTLELGDRYTAFDVHDGYADQTGFLNGFAVGRDLSSGESWLLHCYGALGMGRANELDSGGTELYIVNGPAQRYLDRNVTVFGRVISGMQHIQSLKRGADINGPIDLKGKNVIQSIRMASDLKETDKLKIEVMDTASESFKRLLKARKNRSGEWFVHQHDYMDACGVPIPSRLQSKGK